MTEAQHIADQLRRAVNGEAWSGPSLAEVLKGVTAQQAAAKPITGSHSIWEITLHIAVWCNVPRHRLHGERVVKISPAEDWPAVADASEAAWQRDREQVFADLSSFADEIAGLSDARLSEELAQAGGKLQSVWFMLHGVVQHVLYHAGQIPLLKNAVASGK